jgi:prepilin-type N-terminal cleavage/methylation domain-containing protein
MKGYTGTSLNNGYSLIEILVVTVILSIITLGGLAAYKQFADKQLVTQAANDLITQLRMVQKMADAGEKPVGCGTDPLKGYIVSYDTAFPGTINVVVDCSPTTVTLPKPITLKNNTTLSSDFDLTFLTLSQGTDGGETLTLNSSGSTCQADVVIGTGGAISLDQVSCP